MWQKFLRSTDSSKNKILSSFVFIGLVFTFAVFPLAQPRKVHKKTKLISPAQKALQLFKQKNWEAAAQAFTAVLQRDDKNAEFFYQRGFCYSSLAKHEAALRDYDQAIKLNLQTGAVFFGRGMELANAKKYVEAVTDFDRAALLGWQKWNLYYARAEANFKLKNYEATLPDLTRATELLTEKDEDFYLMMYLAFQMRGNAYFELRDYLLAEEDYSRALEFTDEDPTLYLARAKALRQQNKLNAAEKDEATFKELTKAKN